MQLRVWLIIGITGLNICLLPGQEEAWEQHLLNGRKLRTQALYKEAEKEYLAAVGHSLGRNKEAEALYLRSIAMREKSPSADAADVAAGWNNLGELYLSTGRYREAEALLRRSLA